MTKVSRLVDTTVPTTESLEPIAESFRGFCEFPCCPKEYIVDVANQRTTSASASTFGFIMKSPLLCCVAHPGGCHGLRIVAAFIGLPEPGAQKTQGDRRR
jgi:hypothetical protein